MSCEMQRDAGREWGRGSLSAASLCQRCQQHPGRVAVGEEGQEAERAGRQRGEVWEAERRGLGGGCCYRSDVRRSR